MSNSNTSKVTGPIKQEETAVKVAQPQPQAIEKQAPISAGRMQLGQLAGDYDASDIKPPRLNLVQGLGDLAEDFPAGAFVFNREIILSEPSKNKGDFSAPVELTILGSYLQFQEDKPYNPDEPPVTVNTLDEVLERGGSVRFQGNERPTWNKLTTYSLLIKAPNETVAELFAYEAPDGNTYDMALWSVQKTAHATIVKPVLTHNVRKLGPKKIPLFQQVWELTARREKRGSYNPFVPSIKPTSLHSDEMVSFILSLMGGGTAN